MGQVTFLYAAVNTTSCEVIFRSALCLMLLNCDVILNRKALEQWLFTGGHASPGGVRKFPRGCEP